MKFLAIKSYWKHQHYHKRGAPWIKLHSSVLSDAAFIQLPEVAQAQLMKLWSLASQLGHPLPNNPKLLAGKIGTTGRFHLPSLIAAGFIVPCETEAEAALVAKQKNEIENASNLLDESSSPSREIEIEGEIEDLHLHPSAAEAEAESGLAALLDSDADRNALTIGVSRASNRLACLKALHSMLTGNDPATPQPTSAVFGEALRDIVTNGERITARKFRNYLGSATRRAAEAIRVPPPGASAPATGIGARRESWKDADERREREEGQRRLIRDRNGNIDQRRALDDGPAWWARMQREAKHAGIHPVLYGFDHLKEPAVLEDHTHV